MIAARLLQRLETNWEKIAKQVIWDRDQSPDLLYYKALSDLEIRERTRDLTLRLGEWLTESSDAALATHFEELGRRRYSEGLPLHEVIQKMNIIKRAIRTYVTEQNYNLTPIEIYEELELTRAMASFFDFVIFRVAKGYEEALRESQRAGQATLLAKAAPFGMGLALLQ